MFNYNVLESYHPKPIIHLLTKRSMLSVAYIIVIDRNNCTTHRIEGSICGNLDGLGSGLKCVWVKTGNLFLRVDLKHFLPNFSKFL